MIRTAALAVVSISAILCMTGCNNTSSTGTSDDLGTPSTTTAMGWKLISNLQAGSIVSLNGTLFATLAISRSFCASNDIGSTWEPVIDAPYATSIAVCGANLVAATPSGIWRVALR